MLQQSVANCPNPDKARAQRAAQQLQPPPARPSIPARTQTEKRTGKRVLYFKGAPRMRISVLKGALMELRFRTSMIEHINFVGDYTAEFVVQEGYAATMIRHVKAVLPKWSYDPEYDLLQTKHNKKPSNEIKARLQAGLRRRFERLAQQTEKGSFFRLLMDELAPETATEARTNTSASAPTAATRDEATITGSTNAPEMASTTANSQE